MKFLKNLSASALMGSLLCLSPLSGFDYSPAQEASGKGIQLYGEYLYWKVVQDQMQYAAALPGGVENILRQIGEGEPPVRVREKLAIVDPKFNYNSGFRIGLGYAMGCSDWDFQLAWLRLHETVSSHVSDQSRGIIPITIPASSLLGFVDRDPSGFGFASRADSCWRFELDVIDFQIGRSCHPFHSLSLSPYVGLKAAYVKQHQAIHYCGFAIEETPIDVHNAKKNDFKAIGPSFELDSSWELFPSLHLTSGIGGALLFGKFDTGERPEISQASNSIQVCLDTSKQHRLRPVVDANIGIDWSRCLGDTCKLVIGVSYEVQYWWNQWQVPASVESSLINGGLSPQGDLMMYGLTVNAAITF